MKPKDQILEVWGDLACFTRPEFKVERLSYQVITPSAARGIYDAIYCKPNKNITQAEFHWQVTQIEILAPPKFIALRRNEVKEKAAFRSIGSCINNDNEDMPVIWADGSRDELGTDQKGRTQRQTMALKSVHYRLHAEIRPWPAFSDRLPALEAQFQRRASQGKCLFQPYLGCREFPAYFEYVETNMPLPPAIPLDLDIGLMLYDVFDLSKPGTCESEPCISLFRATIRNGILTVPDYTSDQVYRGLEVTSAGTA
jgi:CRISPR-associated protein Cas5d